MIGRRRSAGGRTALLLLLLIPAEPPGQAAGGMGRDSRYESRQWTPASELGIKLRTRITGKRRLFALGYGFAGLRVGLRFSGFNEVRRTRLAVEVGPGVW